MKKFLALLMALTLCLSMAAPAFAAGVAEDDNVSAATVVYEDDKIVVYDARGTDYGYVWFDSKGSLQEDNIYVNTGLSGTVRMTLGIESSSKKSHAFVYVYNPNGTMLYLKNDMTGTYRINVHNVYAPAGTRVMCWIY